jgi:hypothetical protein
MNPMNPINLDNDYWRIPNPNLGENLEVAQQIVNQYFRNLNATATRHPDANKGRLIDDMVGNVSLESYSKQLELILAAQCTLQHIKNHINK